MNDITISRKVMQQLIDSIDKLRQATWRLVETLEGEKRPPRSRTFRHQADPERTARAVEQSPEFDHDWDDTRNNPPAPPAPEEP